MTGTFWTLPWGVPRAEGFSHTAVAVEVWGGSKTSRSSAKEQQRGTLLLPAVKLVQLHVGQGTEKEALQAGDPAMCRRRADSVPQLMPRYLHRAGLLFTSGLPLDSNHMLLRSFIPGCPTCPCSDAELQERAVQNRGSSHFCLFFREIQRQRKAMLV